ncbi:MAG: dockerin type I repeat-containing protein [Planctomycetota bacterium]
MIVRSLLLGALCALGCTSSVWARPDSFDHTFSATSSTAPSGGTTTSSVLYTNFSINEPVQGWSFGLCNDATLVTPTLIQDGTATAGLNGGSGPDFNQVNVLADGWTVGVVVSFVGTDTLPPGLDDELNVATYDVIGNAGDSADLCFCDTLGDPPVVSVIVIEGASLTPAFFLCGTVDITEGAPPLGFVYTSPDATVCDAFSNPVQILDEAGTNETQGFSMAMIFDETVLDVTGIAPAPALQALNGGAGPDFFGDNLFPNGWTVGVVYAFVGGQSILFDTSTDAIIADYTVDAGVADGSTTTIDCTELLGSPPVANVVVVGGASLPVNCEAGTITVDCPDFAIFLRGDCNTDGLVDIADGIWILNELFLSGSATTCVAACDANFDGVVDASDATYIFNYRFLDGDAPSAPFPACGGDGVSLDCDASGCP